MKQTPLETQDSTPTTADVTDWIRDQIRANRFVPGQRLVEADLIRKTGSSRFKVREALQRLAAMGLVKIEEFRGASVREASMEEIRQLYRARAALEGLCMADFTRIATAAEKKKFYALAEEMEGCLDASMQDEFGALNVRWHKYIAQVSGNQVLEKLIQRLHTPVQHLLYSRFYSGDRLREALEDHRRIVDAVKQGDAEAAEAAMRLHVENGLRFMTSIDKAVHAV